MADQDQVPIPPHLKARPKDHISYRDLSPAKSIKREIFAAAGLPSISKKPRSKPSEPKDNREPYKELPPRTRRQDKRRQQGLNRRKLVKKGISTAIKSGGNPLKAGASLLRDKEIQNFIKSNKGPLFWAIAGDAMDFIPFIGWLLNWACVLGVSASLNKRGIPFWKTIKNRKDFELNLIAEIFLGMIAFYPGLTIFTVQALLSKKD